MSWKLTCRDAGDVILELPDDLLQAAGMAVGDTLELECDVCDASTAETGHGVLQAQWRDGEAEGMRLCRSCFNYAISTLKRAHWVNHMFDDDEPEQEGKE